MKGDDGFDIFVVCNAERKPLDVIVPGDDPVTVMLRSDRILVIVERFLIKTFNHCALYLRRDHVWDMFLSPTKRNTDPPSLYNLRELCEVSSVCLLNSLDSRLESLIVDYEHELQLDWIALCQSAVTNSIWSTFTFVCPGPDSSTFILMKHRGNDSAFIMIDINNSGLVNNAYCIVKDRTEEAKSDAARKRTVEVFVNWILKWILYQE